MIPSSGGEKDFQAKQEGETNNEGKFPKVPSSSRQWSAFRNPRIVRVSRTFGGKDRHSKVCTIRGLRDRRIRLSVPTAIQLYDLQDRLGLNQPSKVIDWLLDATKNDIDKLPPLQLPPGFGQFHSPMVLSHEPTASQSTIFPFFDANPSFVKDEGFPSLGIKIGSGFGVEDQNMLTRSKYWEVEASLRAKSKEVERITEKGKWVRTNVEENQDGVSNYSSQISAQNLFPLSTSHSPLPSGLLTNPIPFNSYYHLDASNLSLSQLGSHGFLSQADNPLTNNAIPLQSSLALASASQLLFCPQPATHPSLFPTYPPYVTSSVENDHSREINHFQLPSSSNSQHVLQNPRAASYPVKPFSLSVSPGAAHLQANDEGHPQERDIEDS